MRFAVYVLGLSVFCIGTTEFMVSGLLPELASDFSVSIPTAGLLISGYALGVVVGGPVLTVATLRMNRKATLLGLLALFVIGQTIGTLASGYGMLMVGRVVAALAQGAFFGVGSIVAVELAGPGRQGRALAVMFGGLTVANVLGVPMGTFLGQQGGWRLSFLVVDVLAVLALVGVAAVVPRMEASPQAGLRSQLRAFRRPPVWSALTTSMLTQAAVFSAFSYLAPLFTDVAGFSAAAVSPLLLVFGVGSLAGNVLGGRLADRHLSATLYVGITAMAAVLVVLWLGADSKTVVLVAIALFGVAAFSINPALQAQVIQEAGDAPTLATTTNTSAFNVGNTIGPWLGGLVISAGLGLAAPPWVGALLAVAGLVAALTTGVLRRRAGAGGVTAPPVAAATSDR